MYLCSEVSSISFKKLKKNISTYYMNEDDDVEFHRQMIKFGSFPKGERNQAYQEYYYRNAWVPAEREINNRASLMGFIPKPNERIVEIGCQTGGFMQYAWLLGVKNVTGVDYDEDYIRLANHMNKVNGHEIKYRVGNALDNNLINDLSTGERIDHLLLMSMGKHIGEERLFYIIDKLNARNTYIETNAVSKKNERPYHKNVTQRGGNLVCQTNDRNQRLVYVIHKD